MLKYITIQERNKILHLFIQSSWKLPDFFIKIVFSDRTSQYISLYGLDKTCWMLKCKGEILRSLPHCFIFVFFSAIFPAFAAVDTFHICQQCAYRRMNFSRILNLVYWIYIISQSKWICILCAVLVWLGWVVSGLFSSLQPLAVGLSFRNVNLT